MASDILHFHEKYAGSKRCDGFQRGTQTGNYLSLTQMKEEVEEMEMSGEHEGMGRRESGGCYLGPRCVNS